MSSIIGVDTCGAGKALSTALHCIMKLYIKTYDPSFDKYHSEIAAIALLEASQLLNEGSECIDYEQEQLYRMTPLPPRFLLEKILRNSANPSEILYLFTTRRLLGTGASEGVPVYGCSCPACMEARRDPRYRRKPTALLISSGDEAIVIDMGYDVAELIDESGLEVKAVLLTHWHHDHFVGLYRFRWSRRRIPLYAPRGERIPR